MTHSTASSFSFQITNIVSLKCATYFLYIVHVHFQEKPLVYRNNFDRSNIAVESLEIKKKNNKKYFTSAHFNVIQNGFLVN